MKLEWKIEKTTKDQHGNEQLMVPECHMQIVPNIILSPKEQQILQQLMGATWDHFVENVILRREKKEFFFDPSIIYPKDPTASPQRIKEYQEYYPVKYLILREHLEKTGEKEPIIVEIGVRAGYSAWTFMNACPNATYIGFDANNGTHGGQGGQDKSFMAWAHHILAPFQSQFGADISIVELDTQTVDTLKLNGETLEDIVDFFHVDGDHTEAGVYNDLDLAYLAVKKKGKGLILVDDYDYIEEVKIGVDNWLADRKDYIKWEYRKSLRGEILIWRLQ